MLGAVLLVGIPVIAVTGLLSYAAYSPHLPSNELTPERGLFGFYLFDWPTRPPWLYRLNQGLHVLGGIALVPVLLAKLWSVVPKLFDWPPTRSVAQTLERLNIALIVGGSLFQFATGILNIQYDYLWEFSFYDAHLYGAWVFLAAFGAHVVIKFPTMVRSLRSRSLRAELRTGLSETRPEPPDPDDLVSPNPAPPTLSRRGLLGLVAGASALLAVLSAGQSLGGPFRRLALLSPRGRDYGDGPNDFQVNTTFTSTGIDEAATGEDWRLELAGGSDGGPPVVLSREELSAMPQSTHDLPIACVEGWSTVQRWTGVRLADLAASAGVADPVSVLVSSLQGGGPFAESSLSADQVADERSLLALQVNGAPLSLDHGFPARVIVPALPGVLNTKWVKRMTFAPR